MDKKVFLIDKESYGEELVSKLTEKDLEEWVAESDYEDDSSVLKVDANGYDTVEEAVREELGEWIDLEDYYVFTFGF